MKGDVEVTLEKPLGNAGIPTKQKLPFVAENDSDLFFRQVVLLLIKEFDTRRKKHVSTENFQILYHGQGWSFQRHEKEGYKHQTGELGLMSNSCMVEIDRIIAHDVTVISDFICKTADAMESQLFEKLLATISSTAKEVGNTISIPKSGSYADAFLEMIKGIEYMVDATGKVSLPTLTCSPEMFEKLSREVEQRGPEFQKSVSAVREEREQHALAKEAERLARYDLPE